VVIEVEVP